MKGGSLQAGLYLVPTPVGNLGDMTERARQVLASCDLIAAEDTRVAGQLLRLLGLPKKPMVSCHAHNEAQTAEKLLPRLEKEAVALVSDAGTPLLSDPGFALVRACREKGIPVTALPGASALLPALQLSGLPCGRFLFYGFLPPKSAARKKALEELKAVPAPLVFYEAPHRIEAALADMLAVFGDAPASLSREITKKFEETLTLTLAGLLERVREKPPKGEIVLVVAPEPAAPAGEKPWEEALEEALAAGSSVKDASAAVAAQFGISKSTVYKKALGHGGK